MDRLRESVFLQGRINAVAQKQLKFSQNPFLSNALNAINDEEIEDDDETKAKKESKVKMEDGGFTVV